MTAGGPRKLVTNMEESMCLRGGRSCASGWGWCNRSRSTITHGQRPPDATVREAVAL